MFAKIQISHAPKDIRLFVCTSVRLTSLFPRSVIEIKLILVYMAPKCDVQQFVTRRGNEQ